MGQESLGEDAYLLLLVYLSWVIRSAYIHCFITSSYLPHEKSSPINSSFHVSKIKIMKHEVPSLLHGQSLDPHLTLEHVMQPTTKMYVKPISRDLDWV